VNNVHEPTIPVAARSKA